MADIQHEPLCLCSIDPCREERPCYPEDCYCECFTLRRVQPIIELQARADERLKALVVIHDSDSVEDAAAAVMMMP